MSAEECLAEYPQIARKVFVEGKRSLIGRIKAGSKYDHGPLVNEIKRLIAERTNKKDPRMGDFVYENFPSPDDLCKTSVHFI
jgi:hypothetical protein